AVPMNELDGWEPVSEVLVDAVPASAAVALHGLLDTPGEPPAAGDLLPPLWHWLTFLPRVPQRELGSDGHPRRGGFLPPVSLPRRMFAGGRLELRGPLRIAETLTRASTITSVEHKTGRSGELVFVTVRHEISQDAEPAVIEEQDLVYRGETAPGVGAGPAPGPDGAGLGSWAWSWELPIDPTVLFRFSALTYNAHRIHYDRDYATQVEGYPGLVVHGPLQAISLAELARRQADRPLSSFRFRALRPVFDEGPLRLRGAEDGGTASLVAFDRHGQRSMEADAVLAGR
ncbi:MAG: MaoC family dehydratase N-terminal domain-containing protein, partial [Acidimicrobiales bacterium]